MFKGMHGRHCGPRGEGRWQRGPFTVSWEVGGEHDRGRGRGRRMFDGGELRLVLLKLIADETRHGYELIRAIEEMTGGAYAPSPGIVYPTLSLLDEMGLIAEQQSDDAKKRFAVTETGRAHLAANQPQVDALIARLTALGAHRERTDRAPVRRAMGNLRVVLQDRVGRGDLGDEALHDIAALIDEVAQKIERLR
ncbi:MAG TPA: PadR family transcriptional regulator [Sphingomonas sp.]|nr:PadR family transcriptional regulator [Sphingomonas sp.]